MGEGRRGCEEGFGLEKPDASGRAICVWLGTQVDRDVLVVEIVVEFIVEPLDILERRNDLLQIVVLESRVNDKHPGGRSASSPVPCRK